MGRRISRVTSRGTAFAHRGTGQPGDNFFSVVRYLWESARCRITHRHSAPRSDRWHCLLTRHPYQFQYLSGRGVHLTVWRLRTWRCHPGLTYQAVGARRLAPHRSDSTGSRVATPSCPDGRLSRGYWSPTSLGSNGYRL